MPLCEKTEYVKEPTSLQCGQAVLAMLSGKSVNEIIEITGTERETTLKDMLSALGRLDIEYERERIQAYTVSDLPEICMPVCVRARILYQACLSAESISLSVVSLSVPVISIISFTLLPESIATTA